MGLLGFRVWSWGLGFRVRGLGRLGCRVWDGAYLVARDDLDADERLMRMVLPMIRTMETMTVIMVLAV